METQTQGDWKYHPLARVAALLILTAIVLGIDRTLVRWLPPSLSWSISAVILGVGRGCNVFFLCTPFRKIAGEVVAI